MKRLMLGVLTTAFVGWTSMASANLITNGDFETGFTGWTASADGFVAVDNIFFHSGSADAVFSAPNPISPGLGDLSQNVTTTAGQNYMLSFFLQDESAPSALDQFQVTFGGNIVATINGDDPSFTAGGYQSFSVPIAGTGASNAVGFQGGNDIAAWNLDDVSLDPVTTNIPEPPAALIFTAGLIALAGVWQLSRPRTQ